MLTKIRGWFKSWFKMTPAKARKLWSKALRSGKYTQTKGKLQNTKGYCCLGVACEVYQQHVGDLVVEKVLEQWSDYTLYDGVGTLLPKKVQDWLGVTTHGHLKDGEQIQNGNSAHSLTLLNDECGYSFNQIADLIDGGKLKTNA